MRLFMVILISGIAWLGYMLWLGNHRSYEYEQVQKGNSETLVKQMLGAPDRISGPPKNVAWDSEDSIHANNGDCTQELWYAPPLSLDGEEWAIGFDRNGNTVSKYHYQSP